MNLIPILVLAAVTANAADMLECFNRKLTVPAASDWTVGQEDGTQVLRLEKSRGPLPGPRRPIQFALAEVPDYSRVTVEADLKPLGGSLMIVFAYRDEAHFDYAHLSIDRAEKQAMHNGVFHVYGGERVRISATRGPASFLEKGRWHHVKLVHDAIAGTVSVTVDGQAVPALDVVDLSLGAGKVGFGSFDETGAFKNVKITATPAARP